MIGELDSKYWERGYVIIGVDEVGRGCIAGPVSAGAVMLAADPGVKGINDSKSLSPKKRACIYEQLVDSCFFAVSHVSHEVIDEEGITEATNRAMRNAISTLIKKHDLKVRGNWWVLVDGNIKIPKLGIENHKAIVRGDSISLAIAAASIVAKVERDRLMVEYGKQYPKYHFEQHKGYGTQLHKECIEEHGLCSIHRRSVRTPKKVELNKKWKEAVEQNAPWYELQRLGRYR